MPPTQVNGRGLALMRISTDSVELRRRGTGGLAVRMSKRLRWERDTLGAEISDADPVGPPQATG